MKLNKYLKRMTVLSVISFLYLSSNLTPCAMASRSTGRTASEIILESNSNINIFDSNPDLRDIVKGNNEFAFNLYKQIKDSSATEKNEGNIFFSPYSISAALAMTYTGARNNTAKQISDVLCLPSAEIEKIADNFNILQNNLLAAPEISGYELNIANSLWLNTGYDFLTEFTDINKKYFDSGISKIEFSKPVESAQIINTWIEKQTKDKIKNMIGPDVINPALTELILTNAIYFKGPWVTPFRETDTKSSNFYIAENKTIEVPMMYQKASRYIGYAETDDIQLLLMPYGSDDNLIRRQNRRPGISSEQMQQIQKQGKRLTMLIILPKNINNLDLVEKGLNHEMLQSYIDKMQQQNVIVYLPKFKIAFDTIELKDILIEMGMKDAFSSGVADFSGMNGKKDLFLYTVLHKTYIDVNEKGTEAAAATAVGGTRGGPGITPPVFRADKPFIFMIRDNHTGSILFMGRVVNPTFNRE